MMKGVIYARVSSTGDRQNTERQIFSLTNWGKKNDVEIDHIFSEKISGGKRNSERLVLQECLTYCVENKIDLDHQVGEGQGAQYLYGEREHVPLRF